MNTVAPIALTVGEIARRLGQPVHRITYLIESRNIRHAARAGHIRLFTDGDIEFIASEIRQIDADREVRG